MLYGCETWSLRLREECRLLVFENKILKQTFGPKRDENGEWKRLHNEKLHSLYHSPNKVKVIKSRRLRWAGHIARMEDGRSAFKAIQRKKKDKREGVYRNVYSNCFQSIPEISQHQTNMLTMMTVILWRKNIA